MIYLTNRLNSFHDRIASYQTRYRDSIILIMICIGGCCCLVRADDASTRLPVPELLKRHEAATTPASVAIPEADTTLSPHAVDWRIGLSEGVKRTYSVRYAMLTRNGEETQSFNLDYSVEGRLEIRCVSIHGDGSSLLELTGHLDRLVTPDRATELEKPQEVSIEISVMPSGVLIIDQELLRARIAHTSHPEALARIFRAVKALLFLPPNKNTLYDSYGMFWSGSAIKGTETLDYRAVVNQKFVIVSGQSLDGDPSTTSIATQYRVDLDQSIVHFGSMQYTHWVHGQVVNVGEMSAILSSVP